MINDRNGRELTVGDTVLVPCKIAKMTSISGRSIPWLKPIHYAKDVDETFPIYGSAVIRFNANDQTRLTDKVINTLDRELLL